MSSPSPTPDFHEALARRWAPIHWQDVDPSDKWRGDLLSAIDFDGDWRTIGNWAAMEGGVLLPVVYYSVAETATHWYLLYAFYHPRDWATGVFAFLDEHENDIEGILLLVEKPGSLAGQFQYGQLLGMITIAHNHFYSYTSSLEEHFETKDGELFRAVRGDETEEHPCSRQEAKGHGCYGLKPTNSGKWKEEGEPLVINDGVARLAFDFRKSSGIRYYVADEPEEPDTAGSIVDSDVPYVLKDIFALDGLWQQRCAPLNEPFTEEFKRLAGLEKGKDKASPPWSWDDRDDGPAMRAGIIATDPARLALHYFTGFGVEPSIDYIRNPYLSPPVCGGTIRTRSMRTSQARLEMQLRSAMTPGRSEDIGELAWRANGRRADMDRLTRAARGSLAQAVRPSQGRARRSSGPAQSEQDAADRLHEAVPAIRILGQLGDRQSAVNLVNLLESSTNREVLLACLEALARMKPGNLKGFKAALTDLLGTGDPRVCEAATRLYAKVFARRDPKPLEKLIADPNATVRAEALAGLGASGRRQYNQVLESAASDPSERPFVRVVAARSLIRRQASGRRRQYARSRGIDLDALGPRTRSVRSMAARLTDAPSTPEEYARFCIAREIAE